MQEKIQQHHHLVKCQKLKRRKNVLLKIVRYPCDLGLSDSVIRTCRIAALLVSAFIIRLLTIGSIGSYSKWFKIPSG